MLLCSVFLYFPGRAIPIQMDADALQVPQQRPAQPRSHHTFISKAKSIWPHLVCGTSVPLRPSGEERGPLSPPQVFCKVFCKVLPTANSNHPKSSQEKMAL